MSSATVASVYENRLLAKEDFNDDRKDAGEIGAGHSVTAFYEFAPVGQPLPDQTSVHPLKYQAAAPPTTITDELLTVKLRYKALDGDSSRLLEVPVRAARKSPSTRRLRTSSSLPQWRHSNEAAELSPKREYLLGGYPENRSTQFERRFRNLSCGVSHARRRGSLMNPARAKRLTNRLGDRGR